VKEFWKLVRFWQSYRHQLVVRLFRSHCRTTPTNSKSHNTI